MTIYSRRRMPLPSIEFSSALTAVFTFLFLVVSVLTYRQARVLAGHGNPLVVKSARLAGEPTRPRLASPIEPGLLHLVRRGVVYIFNRSDAQQRVVVDPVRTRIVWPRGLGQPMAITLDIELAPHDGGNIGLLFIRTQPGDWPQQFNNLVGGRALIYLRIESHSGHVRRALVPLNLEPHVFREAAGVAG